MWAFRKFDELQSSLGESLFLLWVTIVTGWVIIPMMSYNRHWVSHDPHDELQSSLGESWSPLWVTIVTGWVMTATEWLMSDEGLPLHHYFKKNFHGLISYVKQHYMIPTLIIFSKYTIIQSKLWVSFILQWIKGLSSARHTNVM